MSLIEFVAGLWQLKNCKLISFYSPQTFIRQYFNKLTLFVSLSLHLTNYFSLSKHFLTRILSSLIIDIYSDNHVVIVLALCIKLIWTLDTHWRHLITRHQSEPRSSGSVRLSSLRLRQLVTITLLFHSLFQHFTIINVFCSSFCLFDQLDTKIIWTHDATFCRL